MSEITKSVVNAVRGSEHAELLVGGVPFEVTTVDGKDGLSSLFRFEVLCRVPNASPPPFELTGKPATLTFNDGFGTLRPMHGVVQSATRRVHDDEFAHLKLIIVPEAFLMTLGRDSRVFQDMTVPDIINKIMGERSKAPFRQELVGNYRERVYTAQYRENDFIFLSRLAEEDGIYYWFDHGPTKSELVWADDSTNAPTIKPEPLIEFNFEAGMLGHKEMISEFSSTCHATPTKFTVGSFDEQNPQLKVTATQGDGIHELYDAPGGGPEDPAHCAHQAKVRLEIANAARHGVQGSSSSVRLVPGMRFIIAGHANLDGEYLVTESRYVVRQARRFTDLEKEAGFEVFFKAIPARVPFRAPEDSPVTKQAGVQSGRVVGPPGEEIYTDNRGRVRLQLHWDREGGWDDKAGKWMRVAQRNTSQSMLYPRIGWNVMTFMLEGSVDAPQVMSRVHDAEHPPTYPLPENKSRTVWKTMTSPADGSSNEIMFEDKAGGQLFFMNASKDMNYVIEEDSSDNVSNDSTYTVAGNQTVKIDDHLTHSVENDRTVNIGGNEDHTVEGDRACEVKGTQKYDVGGNRKLKCGDSYTISVKESRTCEIGADCEEECDGNILVQSKDTTYTIGGSLRRKTESLITEECGGIHTCTIGGSKKEKCHGDRAFNVNENFTEEITGKLLMKTNDMFMDGSDKTTFWTVESAIKGKAPVIWVEAKETITLKVGSSTLFVDENKVEIKSDSYELDGDELDANTMFILQN